MDVGVVLLCSGFVLVLVWSSRAWPRFLACLFRFLVLCFCLVEKLLCDISEYQAPQRPLLRRLTLKPATLCCVVLCVRRLFVLHVPFSTRHQTCSSRLLDFTISLWAFTIVQCRSSLAVRRCGAARRYRPSSLLGVSYSRHNDFQRPV